MKINLKKITNRKKKVTFFPLLRIFFLPFIILFILNIKMCPRGHQKIKSLSYLYRDSWLPSTMQENGGEG